MGVPLGKFLLLEALDGGFIITLFVFSPFSKLSAMFNYAVSLQMIIGYDHHIPSNFDHLMYANDLIITRAIRKTARNCRMCLHFYENLTCQKPNNVKSTFYLPG